MANPALGRKFACHSCGTKFYDLNKPDPRCPKCGSAPELQPSEPAPKSGRGGSKRARPAPVVEPRLDDEEPAFEDEEASAFVEDEEAGFEDEDAAFEDEDMAEGEEEAGGEEEEP